MNKHHMIETQIASAVGKRISRRAAMKGAIAAFGLPALEAFAPRHALAQSAQDNFVVLYIPNGRRPEWWAPEVSNGQLSFPTENNALQNHANRILFCRNLNNEAAKQSPGAAHAMGTTTLLCGNKINDQRALENGISVDQAIASVIGTDSRFPSLQWSSGEPGPCDVGGSACAHTQSVSWAGRNQPLAPQIRPDAAFNQLFGTSVDGLQGQAASMRRNSLKSVLDTVYANGQSLTRDLGAEDKSRLDQFFTGVRQVEERLQEVQLDCTVGGAPANFEAYPARVDAFIDLIALALSCGQTKVISYMIEYGLSGRSHPFINAPGGHHALSHYGNADQKEQLRRLEQWQNGKVAKLIDTLSNTPGRSGGSVLDETTLLCIPSMGAGSNHDHRRNCPMIVGGRTFDTRGRLVNFAGSAADNADGENLSNLHVTLLESFGITKKFGHSGARFGDAGNKVLSTLLR